MSPKDGGQLWIDDPSAAREMTDDERERILEWYRVRLMSRRSYHELAGHVLPDEKFGWYMVNVEFKGSHETRDVIVKMEAWYNEDSIAGWFVGSGHSRPGKPTCVAMKRIFPSARVVEILGES